MSILTNYAEEQVAQWEFWLGKTHGSFPAEAFFRFIYDGTAPMSTLTDYDRRKADIYFKFRRLTCDMPDRKRLSYRLALRVFSRFMIREWNKVAHAPVFHDEMHVFNRTAIDEEFFLCSWWHDEFDDELLSFFREWWDHEKRLDVAKKREIVVSLLRNRKDMPDELCHLIAEGV